MTRRSALAAVGISAALLLGGVVAAEPAHAENMPLIACRTWKSNSGKDANSVCRGTGDNYTYRSLATCLRGNGTGTFTKRGKWEQVGFPAYSTAKCGAKVVALRVEFQQPHPPLPDCSITRTSGKAISANCFDIQDRRVRSRGTCKSGSHKWALRGQWKKTGNSTATCSGSGKLTGNVEFEISPRST
ncbi:hypothetical protein [Streptomyces sp. NPDC059010]|uniref:hypothetical protein n=1 Tax=Streptomyces sp. NPDC059010 TaxID=3346695 RepID=UPI003684667C